jgi:hypothetical protein
MTMNKVAASMAAAVAFALTIPALAQAPTSVTLPKGVFYAKQLTGETLARDRLIGAKVHNVAGLIIGDIEDLILDRENRVIGVIVGVGGVLGVGEKRIGVRMSALTFTVKDGATHVTLPQVTKEILAAVPPYVRAEPKKSLIERSKEKAKEMYDRTGETAKDAADKMKDMMKPTTPTPAAAPPTTTPPVTPPAATPAPSATPPATTPLPMPSDKK